MLTEKNMGELIDKTVSKHNSPTRTLATVKIMRSHDYCHFESSIQIEGENITLTDIDNARKDCQRLCDKAVGQYITAKNESANRASNSRERMNLENEVSGIKATKSEQQYTPLDKAKIKALDDWNHQNRYDYDDDEQYPYL